MKILSHILGRLNILVVEFSADDRHTFSLATYLFIGGKWMAKEEMKSIADQGAMKKILSKHPVVMAVSGKGVITKDVSVDSITRSVTSDPAIFLWTISEGKISFMRCAQLNTVIERLNGTGIEPIYIECLPDLDKRNVSRVAERFGSEHMSHKLVLTPSYEGSRLLSLVAGRLMLPILGVLLFLLVLNFAVSSQVGKRFREANDELTVLKKTSSAIAANDERRQAAIEEFSRGRILHAGRLSDMIVSRVPSKITLNEFGIAPVTKPLETRKPIVQSGNSLVIRGETPVSEAITEFATVLVELRLGTLRLASVEQDRERAVLSFRIEITL